MTEPLLATLPKDAVIDSCDRRLLIAVGCTTVGLPGFRQQAIDAMHRMGHTPLSQGSERSDSDADEIRRALRAVERAHVYVGIVGWRHGHVPRDRRLNPDRLSMTELEYRHAVAVGTPRLMFLADGAAFSTAEQRDHDSGKRERLAGFRSDLERTETVGRFNSPDSLREAVLLSAEQLPIRIVPRDGNAKNGAKEGPNARESDGAEESDDLESNEADDRPDAAADDFELPHPPERYDAPGYTLAQTFVGRSTELERLDEWAESDDPVMVVSGIGGLGKSAIAWEWLNSNAPDVLPDRAGQVWWNFYDEGGTMARFVLFTLAYMTGRQWKELAKETTPWERNQLFIDQLKERPWLIVLDGIERLLRAYHRLDKAQIPDDRIDETLRSFVNPPDGDLLAQLANCSPSKILISTRLAPSALEDRATRETIDGVAGLRLDRLSPQDALAYLRAAGITGDRAALANFAEQTGRHALLLRILCAMIAEYRPNPCDFDAWRADSAAGGALRLGDVEPERRNTHILQFALSGLEAPVRQLLCRIAVLKENTTWDTIAVLNPFLPAAPVVKKKPRDPSKAARWSGLSEDERKKSKAGYQKRLAAWKQSQEELKRFPTTPEYRRAAVQLDIALRTLETRGLLQWDRDANWYDMHPVVRGCAAEMLEEADRTETFGKVRDHFASLPPDDLESATDLSDIARSLEIYRCLIGAGRFDDAFEYYSDHLAVTLSLHIGASFLIIEMLEPLFDDLNELPRLTHVWSKGTVLTELANAYGEMDRAEEKIALHGRAIRLGLDDNGPDNVVIDLLNLCLAYRRLARRRENAIALSLVREICELTDSREYMASVAYEQMWNAIIEGRLDDADSLDAEFIACLPVPIIAYHPGRVEHLRCLRAFQHSLLRERQWNAGLEVAVEHRNVETQHEFHALRAEWELSLGRADRALEAINEALRITNRMGVPMKEYHDLRAWALAGVGSGDDARSELASGERRLAAAEAHRALGNIAEARECARNAFVWAWGDGPPYIHAYYLERSRALLRSLGEPEPSLPPFDPARVPKIPHEDEIREAIARLRDARKKRRRRS